MIFYEFYLFQSKFKFRANKEFNKKKRLRKTRTNE